MPAGQLDRFAPETWTLGWTLLSRPGAIDMRLDLFLDYRTNLALYPEFHAYFRSYAPPTLIVWGSQDPFFTVAGAQTYLRDLPEAKLHLLDAGHFALESHGPVIARLALDFLARRVFPSTALGSGSAEARAAC